MKGLSPKLGLPWVVGRGVSSGPELAGYNKVQGMDKWYDVATCSCLANTWLPLVVPTEHHCFIGS